MKKFILMIDSLINTFSIIEAGKNVTFGYENKNGTEAFENVSKGDIILGYFSEPVKQIKCVFEVREIASAASIVLNKKLEVSNGFNADSSLENELTEKILIEISDEEYVKIFNNLIPKSESIEEDVGVFKGFAPWLTSFDNPDYTGKEKYNGYPRNLERLVKFMLDKGLIFDANLNDKNIEKYLNFKAVYEASEEVREYDKTKLSSFAGIAALKKYIKYVEYLSSSKAQQQLTYFDYSVTGGEGINKIFYGTPGCGKSYHIEYNILGRDQNTKKYNPDNYAEENVIRTTFYQDYSNTDFVGQILPKLVRGKNGEKDSVEYLFNPGPFTLALIRAISNPTKKVALVIEEINRGNAPAIFGDVFQLLDRDDDCISEYGIVNVGVMDYLNNYTFKVNGEDKKYIFKDIKIPGNMYIYATMNTSDQNVYTLDTAFVRRWSKEKIQNSFGKCKFKGVAVPGMINYTWEEFVTGINSRIVSHLEALQVNEDKQIGAYFVKERFLKESSAEEFAYKVFDYLWSDVAKLDHGVFFKPYDTLDKLITAYKTEGVKIFQNGIFAEKNDTPTQENNLTQDDDNNE